MHAEALIINNFWTNHRARCALFQNWAIKIFWRDRCWEDAESGLISYFRQKCRKNASRSPLLWQSPKRVDHITQLWSHLRNLSWHCRKVQIIFNIFCIYALSKYIYFSIFYELFCIGSWLFFKIAFWSPFQTFWYYLVFSFYNLS